MHCMSLTLALAAALGACVASNGDEGILITKNVAPGTGCMFTSEETEPYIPHGMLAMTAPGGYRFHPQMKSRITASDDQIDQRTVIVQGARIDLAFADPNLFTSAELATLKSRGVTHFEAAFSAPLLPNGGLTDGGFDLFNHDLIEAVGAKVPGALTGTPTLRTELIATVTVFGDLSGQEVLSQEFKYPVTLCNDCIFHNLGACNTVPAGTKAREGNACSLYQDDAVDCCTNGTAIVCPAVSTLTAL